VWISPLLNLLLAASLVAKKPLNAVAVVSGRGANSMFDIFKVFNDNKAVLAEIPRFVNAWIDFMNKLHERLTRFEAALERLDNKLQTVIEIVSDGHPATVSPELHAVVADWASDDPRNKGFQDNYIREARIAEQFRGRYDP